MAAVVTAAAVVCNFIGDTEDVAAVAADITVAATMATVLGPDVLVAAMFDAKLAIMVTFVGAIEENGLAMPVILFFTAPADALTIAGMKVQPFGTPGPSMSSRIYDMREPPVKPTL